MKRFILIIMAVLFLFGVSCHQKTPDDFDIEIMITGGWQRPIYLSTTDNVYTRYNEQGNKISSPLDWTKEEENEIYQAAEEIWHYFPTSFEPVGEIYEDDIKYDLSITVKEQTKTIHWTGEDSHNDEIAKILTNRVYAMFDIVEKFE